MRVSLLLLLAAFGEVPAQQGSGATAAAPEIINVADGEAKVRPDRVSITIAVVTRAASAGVAGRLNRDRIQPLLAALRRQQIPDTMLTTSGYTVDREDDVLPPGSRPRPLMYVARNAVEATLTRFENLGVVIDTALAAGATEIGDIAFASSMTPDGQRRAIAAAVQAARADAEAAATAAGGRLGPIIEIEVDPQQGMFARRVMRLQEVRVSGASTPLLPNDLTISVQVRVRSVLLRGS